MSTLHATCVAIDGFGVLLRGPSGAGKSDLALRLIDGGAQLVSDDYTVVTAHGGHLVASAPESIKGVIEVRGLGLVPMTPRSRAVVGLLVDLDGGGAVERLPEPETELIDGIALPRLRIAPFEASAAAKVRLAARINAGQDSPA